MDARHGELQKVGLHRLDDPGAGERLALHRRCFRILCDNSDAHAAAAAIVQAYAASVDVPRLVPCTRSITGQDRRAETALAAAPEGPQRAPPRGGPSRLLRRRRSGAAPWTDTDLVDLGALMRRLTDRPRPRQRRPRGSSSPQPAPGSGRLIRRGDGDNAACVPEIWRAGTVSRSLVEGSGQRPGAPDAPAPEGAPRGLAPASGAAAPGREVPQRTRSSPLRAHAPPRLRGMPDAAWLRPARLFGHEPVRQAAASTAPRALPGATASPWPWPPPPWPMTVRPSAPRSSPSRGPWRTCPRPPRPLPGAGRTAARCDVHGDLTVTC